MTILLTLTFTSWATLHYTPAVHLSSLTGPIASGHVAFHSLFGFLFFADRFSTGHSVLRLPVPPRIRAREAAKILPKKKGGPLLSRSQITVIVVVFRPGNRTLSAGTDKQVVHTDIGNKELIEWTRRWTGGRGRKRENGLLQNHEKPPALRENLAFEEQPTRRRGGTKGRWSPGKPSCGWKMPSAVVARENSSSPSPFSARIIGVSRKKQECRRWMLCGWKTCVYRLTRAGMRDCIAFERASSSVAWSSPSSLFPRTGALRWNGKTVR